MNTLSKILTAVCLLLATAVFAKWERTGGASVRPDPVIASSEAGVALATSADGKIVYYANSTCLSKSTDGGETWTVLVK
jgi:hypothetical protein